MATFVTVKFLGTARIQIRGTMEVPQEMWDVVAEGDAWSEEIEKYIIDNLDGLHHFAEDPDDIEIDDVITTTKRTLIKHDEAAGS